MSMSETRTQHLLVVAVLLCLLILVMAAFDEVPASQIVPIGSESICRCRHPGADNIRWSVNGTLIGRNPPPDITPGTTRDEADKLVDILTIIARLEYNGTTVVCVAEFDDGTPDETSEPPAMLLIQADINATVDTPSDFLTSPLSVNVAVGTETMFYCEHSTAEGFGWLINGTALNSQPDLRNTFMTSTNGSVRTLTVTALSQYNSTRIECVAFFLNDQPDERTPPALLLNQGPLGAVKRLAKVNSTISWGAPFSLDLTNIDPDIVYCVDVYNITCGGRDLVSSDCSVTDTNYTSLSDGYLYEYIVTPRSNVEGAQNGTASQPLKDGLPMFSMASTQLSLTSSDSLTSYQVELNYSPALPIPSSYTLSLEALDGLRDLGHVETTATKGQLNVLLTVTGLEYRRLWNCIVMTYGCEENSILSDETLSTHDFRDIEISTPSDNVVRVIGNFIEGSTAIGVLVVVSSNTESYYHYAPRDGIGLQNADISGIAGSEYSISTFVVEKDGLPFERAAMMPNHLSVEGNEVQRPSPTIEYLLQSNSTGVCIQCDFLTTDASECIVVVHRPHDLMNIGSHKFTRSGDTASGCIEGVNLEDYQVGVMGGKQLRGSNTPRTKTTAIVGIVVSVVIVVLLAVVVAVLLVVVKRNWDRLKSHTQKDGPAPPNPYEPSPPTNNPTVPLFNRVLSDGGNYDTVINMAGGPPPPPQYSALFHPGTTIPTNVGVGGQVNEAMYLTPAEVSSTVNVPVATDDQGNHPGIEHEEINGDQYAVVNKSKKESKSSEDAEGDKKTLVYSNLSDVASSVRAPPTTDDPVAYSTVQHEKGENGDQSGAVNKQESGGDDSLGKTVKESKGTVIYSTPELKCHKVSMPLDDDRVEYVEVKGTNGQTMSPRTKDPAPPPLPIRFTVDNLLSLLRPVTSKWRELSEYMSLNEELIDEIDTNNETDEPCLQAALGWYMKNGDKKHEWEEIVTLLKKMKEPELADKIYDLHVRPYIVPLPGETQPTEERHRQHSDSSSDSGIGSSDSGSHSGTPPSSSDDEESAQHSETASDNMPLPGETQPTEGRQRQHSGSSSDSGIGNSDSDSHSATPPSSSDDEESVQQSEKQLDPVTSTAIQQQTTDPEQGMAVRVMQACDGSTLVRQTGACENAPCNFISDRQVVGALADPVRTGGKQKCQGNHEMVAVVSCFRSDVLNSSPHESVSAVSVQSGLPSVPSEPVQTDYMEQMCSTCNSTSFHLSRSERIRLLRRRHTRSNQESDELWQSQAKAYSLLSESGNQEVTAGKHEHVLQRLPWFMLHSSKCQ